MLKPMIDIPLASLREFSRFRAFGASPHRQGRLSRFLGQTRADLPGFAGGGHAHRADLNSRDSTDSLAFRYHPLSLTADGAG